MRLDRVRAALDQSGALRDSVASFRLRQGTADEARALVERALSRLAEVGWERAVEDFHRPDGPFIDRDLYIFIFDRAGTYFLHGAIPERDGTPLSAIEGLDAAQLVADAWNTCDTQQGGWVYYAITNPVTGEIQAKSSYVVPLDQQRLLGCGCYLNSQWLHL